jgi:hypothetical protein
MLKLIEKINSSEIISLFIPCFPGGYKERDLFTDMRKFSSDIYTVVYPGTEGIDGVLSPAVVVHSVEEAIAELQNKGKKIILFSYSFGSLQIINSTIDKKNIIGLFLFSPIIDLKHCLFHSFTEQLHTLDKTVYTINSDSFIDTNKNLELSWKKYEKKLNIWLEKGISIVYALGLQDNSVDQTLINKLLQEKLNQENKSRYYLYTCYGTHKLDSIYERKGFIYDLVSTIISENKIETHS